MPDDRRAGKGRSLKKTRAAAGAGGIRHPDEVVDLPKAEANALIKAGAAVPVPSARREAESTLVEPTPADLSGLTLAEGVKRFVLEDPKLRQLEIRMQRDCPGWPKGVSSSRCNPSYAQWPVKFEGWSTPEGRALNFEYQYRLQSSSSVPEQVTAVSRWVQNRVALLITWLRDDCLVAEGVEEPPTHKLARKLIDAGWWSRDDIEVNLEKGKLLRVIDDRSVLFFSDIRVWRPEDVVLDTGRQHQPEKKKPYAPPKGTPGRKPKWNWKGANREMMRLANTPNGLPYPQAAIEEHIKNWFVDHYDDSPAESQIREFVVDRLPEKYR